MPLVWQKFQTKHHTFKFIYTSVPQGNDLYSLSWILQIIQKRFDGSVDFYRGWEDYAEGFGDPAGEYWLGLRHIHALTSAQPMQLYIGITDFDLGLRFAKYDSFSVSSEDENFVLRVGTYFGDAGETH